MSSLHELNEVKVEHGEKLVELKITFLMETTCVIWW